MSSQAFKYKKTLFIKFLPFIQSLQIEITNDYIDTNAFLTHKKKNDYFHCTPDSSDWNFIYDIIKNILQHTRSLSIHKFISSYNECVIRARKRQLYDPSLTLVNDFICFDLFFLLLYS